MSNDEAVLKPLPSIDVLMSETWVNFRNKFVMILQIALLPFVFNFVTGFLFGNMFEEGVVKATLVAGNFGLLWQGLFIGFIGILLGVWSTVSMLIVLNDQSVSDSMSGYYGRALRKFFPYIWISLLSSLVVVAGMFLLVVPGIIVSIWSSFAVYVLINENVGGFTALARSREYVRGYWWAVFGRLFLVFVLVFFITFVTSFVLIGLTDHVPTSFQLPSFAASSIQNFLSSIIVAFMFGYGLVLYRQVRAVKGQVIDGSKTWAAVMAGLGVVFAVAALLIVPILLISTSLDVARQKAGEAYAKTELSKVRVSLEMYSYDNGGVYPQSIDLLVPNYMPTLPTNSSTQELVDYEYALASGGLNYSLCLGEGEDKNCATADQGFDR